MRTLPFVALALLVLGSCEYDAFYEPSGPALEGELDTGEQYNTYTENPFVDTETEPISTFSIDADGASYSNARRILAGGMLPDRGALRTEEIINYFPMNYPDPGLEHPIRVQGEVSTCPWNEAHRIVRVSMKGKTIPHAELPPANWVLLADVSGSMGTADKLPLLQKGFHTFVDQMRTGDRLAIVSYAGDDRVVLESTPGTQKDAIHEAIDQLSSGGGTAGAQGILTAYDLAEANLIEGGNNRVILGTDGDFNVGVSSQDELIQLIEDNRDRGIFLSVIGYGSGNLQEGKMEQLANNGNGNFEYVDSPEQSDKVFKHEFGKFYTVAKDVKVQVEWNVDVVSQYRLIGYENRLLANEDFENDSTDAGEIGSGQTITALYEIIPKPDVATRGERAFDFSLRYKFPDEDNSNLLTVSIRDQGNTFDQATPSHRFATTLAGWVMLMWDSEYKEDLTYADIRAWGEQCLSYDPQGYRSEWLNTVLPASAELDQTD